MSRVVAERRAELKELLSARGVPLTYLAFVARATVAALQEHPRAERLARRRGDRLSRRCEPRHRRGARDGLIVPVIHRAQRLSLEGIAAAIADLSTRARSKRAFTRGRPGRHVHDHEPGPVRHRAGDADHQPASGGDPGSRGRRQASGCRSRARTGTRSQSARRLICACPSTTGLLDGAEAARFLGADQVPPRTVGDDD